MFVGDIPKKVDHVSRMGDEPTRSQKNRQLQEGFVPVRGLQVSLKTKEKDDKVLLICNLPTSTQETWDATRKTRIKDHKGAFYD